MSYKGYVKTVLQRPIETQQARLPNEDGIPLVVINGTLAGFCEYTPNPAFWSA